MHPIPAGDDEACRPPAVGGGVLRCDAAALAPDLASVDALARLRLQLGRRRMRLHVVNASAALSRLVELVGLADVLDP